MKHFVWSTSLRFRLFSVLLVLGSICRLHSFEHLKEQLHSQAKRNRLLVLHCDVFVLDVEGYDHDHSLLLEYRALKDGTLTMTGG